MQEKSHGSADFFPKAQPEGQREPPQGPAVEKKAHPRRRKEKQHKRAPPHVEGAEIAGKYAHKGEQPIGQTSAVGHSAPQPAEKIVKKAQGGAQRHTPQKLHPLLRYGQGHYPKRREKNPPRTLSSS